MRRAVVALVVMLAPPWSAPRDVSRPHTFIDDLSIAFVPSSAGLIGWRMQDGAGAGARGGESVVARSVAGGLGAPHSAPRGRAGDVVLYGHSRAAVALVRPVGSNRDPRSELRVAVWTTGALVQAAYAAPGAPFGPPEDVSAGGEADAARAAFSRAGAPPAFVWRTHRAGGTNVQEAARTG